MYLINEWDGCLLQVRETVQILHILQVHSVRNRVGDSEDDSSKRRALVRVRLPDQLRIAAGPVQRAQSDGRELEAAAEVRGVAHHAR